MGLFEMAARWLVKKHTGKQRTFCWCPGCGLELCNSESWFADPSSELVRYRCVQCGMETAWLFDAPVPILVEKKGGRCRGDTCQDHGLKPAPLSEAETRRILQGKEPVKPKPVPMPSDGAPIKKGGW